MKAHLVNWTLGPAILSAILACGGADPLAGPALHGWLELARTIVGLAGFFGAFYVVMFLLRLIAQRLNEGRLVGAEVRMLAKVMAVQWMLLCGAFAVLLTVRHLSIMATGGWAKGWQAALAGGIVGATVGFVLGFGVAQLRLPQRLGLDAPPPTNDAKPAQRST